MLRVAPLLAALLLAVAAGGLADTSPRPGNRFTVAVHDHFLSGEDAGDGRLLLSRDEAPASGSQAFLLPGVSALGAVDLPDRQAWVAPAPFAKATEVAAGAEVELHFTANAQGLAVFQVRLYALAPDGRQHLLAEDEQQFVTALDPEPVRFHLLLAGTVIQAGDRVVLEVQAQTTQAAVHLRYGGDAPSALRGLATRWLDSDADGVADSDEARLGSNPLAPDFPETDGIDRDDDGIPDDVEARIGTDPRRFDSDGDGFGDGVEWHAGSDPVDPDSRPGDSDGDGLPDSFEAYYFTNTTYTGGAPGQPGQPGQPGAPGQAGQVGLPGVDGGADPDGDGCDNACEATHGTDPLDPDTDGDGVPDGRELDSGRSPLVAGRSVRGVPEPVAAAAAFALGSTLCIVPLLRRP